MEIVAATGNAHKVREMSQILAPLGIRVVSALTFDNFPDVAEDGVDFRENAIKKAVEIARALGRVVLADDSGLEVAALDGAPGIYSARYAGEGGNDGRNVRKLLAELDGVSDRRARFVCVVAVASPEALAGTAEGEVRGAIAAAPRGDAGFGYDPVFVPDGYAKTFAELPAGVKNSMSHRRNAIEAAIRQGLFPV